MSIMFGGASAYNMSDVLDALFMISFAMHIHEYATFTCHLMFTNE